MNTKKIIFLVLAVIFLLIMVVFAMDVAQRTTFPGQKSDQIEQDLP